MPKAKTSKELYEKYRGSFITSTDENGIIQGIVLGHSIDASDILLVGVVGPNSKEGWAATIDYFSEVMTQRINTANYPRGFWWVLEDEIVR